jgi:hypothetical protein
MTTYKPVLRNYHQDIFFFGFNSALKRSKSDLGITSSELLILLAGYSIQLRYYYGFKPGGVKKVLPAVWYSSRYSSLDNLEAKGFIKRKDSTTSRSYKITNKGISTINSFKETFKKFILQIRGRYSYHLFY